MSRKALNSIPVVTGIIIGLFSFYIYFRPYLLLGLISGISFGATIYALLRTWKIHRIRLRYTSALTLVTWIGALSLLVEMNWSSFLQYVNLHLIIYESKFGGFGIAHIPFVRQLPYTWGSTILMQLSFPWVELSIPYPVERLLFLIFPFHYPPISLGMLVFVLVPYLALVLVFGRGWCGWICYFGNQTESIASRGRERWKMASLRERYKLSDGQELLDHLKGEVRHVKYFLMIALLLPSFLLGMNTLCTLGLLVKFLYPLGAILIILMLILTGLILPLNTRKRWWCLICPAGAGIGLVDIITPFKIGIDSSKCNKCYACANVCPMHAISPKILTEQNRPNSDCVKCCRCIEVCPRGVIDVYIRGTKRHVRSVFIALVIATAASWYVWFAVSAAEVLTGLF